MMVLGGWDAGKSPTLGGHHQKECLEKEKLHESWKDVRRALGLGIRSACGGRGRPSENSGRPKKNSITLLLRSPGYNSVLCKQNRFLDNISS